MASPSHSNDGSLKHLSGGDDPPGDHAGLVSFSAIVPVKDRPDDLVRIVGALAAQTLPPTEIIIVDQSATEVCRAGVGQWYAEHGATAPELVYVHDPSIAGLTAARNVGLSRSRGDWVLFCDDDSVPVPECLQRIADAFALHPTLEAAGGIITNYRPPHPWVLRFRRFFFRGPFWDERQPVYWNWAVYPAGALIPTTKLTGSCMAFRRKTLENLTGFDERYRGACVGEDVEIAQRVIAYTGRGSSVALVGGAYLQHASLGKWKRGKSSLETEIVSMHYLLKKNLSGTPRQTALNTVRFGWMLTGVLLLALRASARDRSAQPLGSVFSALDSITGGYRGCPFLSAS